MGYYFDYVEDLEDQIKDLRVLIRRIKAENQELLDRVYSSRASAAPLSEYLQGKDHDDG